MLLLKNGKIYEAATPKIEHHPIQFLGHIDYPWAGAAREAAIIDVNPAVSHRIDRCPLRILLPGGFDPGLTEKNYLRVPRLDLFRVANEVCRRTVSRCVDAPGKLDHIILKGARGLD